MRIPASRHVVAFGRDSEPARFTREAPPKILPLLAFLRLGDATPSLHLEKNRYDLGEDVYATISSDGTVLLENQFGSHSIQAQPGQRIKLGKLDHVGVFLIQAKSSLLETEMALIAIPSGPKIDVGIWPASYQYGTPPTPTSIPLTAGDEDLLDKFFDHLNDQIFEDAGNLALHQFSKADRWFGLGFDVAIGGVIAILSPVNGVVYVGKAAIPQLIDFAFIFAKALVDAMDALTDAEKTRLKTIINLLNAGGNLLQIGLRVKNLRRAETLCQEIEALNGMGNLTVKSFNLLPLPASPQDVRIAGSMLRNSVSKSITMVCKIIKHAP